MTEKDISLYENICRHRIFLEVPHLVATSEEDMPEDADDVFTFKLKWDATVCGRKDYGDILEKAMDLVISDLAGYVFSRRKGIVHRTLPKAVYRETEGSCEFYFTMKVSPKGLLPDD